MTAGTLDGGSKSLFKDPYCKQSSPGNSMDKGQTLHPPEENCDDTMREANDQYCLSVQNQGNILWMEETLEKKSI